MINQSSRRTVYFYKSIYRTHPIFPSIHLSYLYDVCLMFFYFMLIFVYDCEHLNLKFKLVLKTKIFRYCFTFTTLLCFFFVVSTKMNGFEKKLRFISSIMFKKSKSIHFAYI